ncbi:MAG: RAD55 family ATPase [Fimbriimonadaceae bacterium]
MGALELQSTGVAGLDRLIGGVPRGSRNLLYGPPGTGKTVFAMQFLWTGLQNGETVAYDVFDRPWEHMRRYFESFGWAVRPFEERGRLLPIQAFEHFDPYPRDPAVEYFSLDDFETMRAIDRRLSAAGVTRFVAGDNTEHVFETLSEERWREVETWTVNWAFFDGVTNFDLMSEAADGSPRVRRMIDLTFGLAHNVFRFRVAERGGRLRRELRIEKMEGLAHPLDWLPFEIGPEGVRLLDA